jgi:radical SAM superfamily enzyme YgiQ (UPF0313 family)
MRVTIIQPNLFDRRSGGAMEVLSAAILKSLTPPDVETEFIDERLSPVPYDRPTGLVALSVDTFRARRAYQIAGQYRARGVPVVMGGFHPTFLPEEAARFADAVVIGDAEGAWPQVIEDARAGRLQRMYRRDGFPPLDDLRPDHSIFAGLPYLPLTLIQCSRGCRFNCTFCSIRGFYGGSIRVRRVGDVVDEIRRLRARRILFVDDNIFLDREWAHELFEALIPLKISWACQASIDIAHNPATLDLMRRSGCFFAFIGIESLHPETLKAINKSWNVKWADYDTSFERLRRAGIMVWGSFIFGHDADTPDSFDEALEFSIRRRFLLADFNPLMPMPGTRLYDEMKRDGRLIYERWWLDPRFRYGQAAFHPRGMTADEFTDGCYRARRRFGSYASMTRRLLDFRTNLRSPYRLNVFALANLTLRREHRAKQMRPLGAMSEPDPLATAMAEPDVMPVARA